MSDKTDVPPGSIFGCRLRSIACLNVSAVTRSLVSGGENAKPVRTVNVYVLPSAERVGSEAATSGTSRVPRGADASG